MMEINIEEYIAQAPGLIIEYGGKVFFALLVFLLGKWISRAISNAIVRNMEKRKVDLTITRFIGSLSYALLFTFVIVAALAQLGIETTSFIAVLGAAGLAVGLALQGSLSNFAAGVLLIIFRPLRAGDFVEAGGATGVVEEVGIFTTTLTTGDNKVIIIPNSSVMGGSITNYSLKAQRRIDLVIGISYDSDIQQAKSVLGQILAEDKRVLAEPAAAIAVAELGDSAISLNVRPWVLSADYWPVRSDLLQSIKQRFDAAGIGIPYPQMDVHFASNAAQE
jgi:small conductance mechanosensitive channel